ncbi:Probable xanthine/uracil permease [Mycobacteroides abscessus subsp. bolletii]|uniref:solute carrier family 23 protein n=1 Tax=Mycobacteroides abscessus TaxID=36809 RepID=UPI000926C3E2|nr:solute carrier family 23 protein [Mycobacteroides abscessus]SII90608.1 Probable xanthine/uracil permease [Mycobacteroides abscessus subsp. bolletii]SLF62255.1 Probable xanthine/uracil permease [Mycobacteroides abscessus subsp. bolletii]
MSADTTRPAAPGAQRKKVHPVDEVPSAGRLVTLGIQHVIAFYAGAVLVPLLIARAIDLDAEALTMLITADLFTCGIASILQAVGFWKIGVRLPLLQGVTFATLAPVIKIANDHGGGRVGLLTVYGAVIAAGAFTFLIAPFFARLIRFFPPVVTGSVITIIGVSLLPVGIGDATRNPHSPVAAHDPGNGRWLMYALGTIAAIVLMQRFFRGFWSTIAVLLGLVAGTVVAWLAGDTDFGRVGEADWIGFTSPFAFGAPRFDVIAVVSLIVVLMVTAVESTGAVFATAEIVGKRVRGADIAATVRADGIATVVGGTFNSFPYTAFSENVGLVRLTGVKSRWVVAAAGVIMMVLGVLPKTAKIVESIPAPVLGGAAMTLFATVAVVGIQTLGKVDFNDHRNLIIASTSLAMGMYVQFSQSSGPATVLDHGRGIAVPALPGIDQAVPGLLQIPFSTGITMGAITAIVLNLLFFHTGSRGVAVAGGGAIRLAQVNEMTLEQFRRTFGGLVQDVHWVVDRAYRQRPFADAHDLRSAFQEAMLTGSDEEQLELIGSFPDLGAEDEAGEMVAVDHTILQTLDEAELNNVVSLATAYREHFGFPLVVCARETERYERLLRSGWSRMENSATSERSFALIEIAKIANYRFDDLVADANPITAARFGRFEDFHATR